MTNADKLMAYLKETYEQTGLLGVVIGIFMLVVFAMAAKK